MRRARFSGFGWLSGSALLVLACSSVHPEDRPAALEEGGAAVGGPLIGRLPDGDDGGGEGGAEASTGGRRFQTGGTDSGSGGRLIQTGGTQGATGGTLGSTGGAKSATGGAVGSGGGSGGSLGGSGS